MDVSRSGLRFPSGTTWWREIVLQSIDHCGKERDNWLARFLRRITGSCPLPTRRLSRIQGCLSPPKECGDKTVPTHLCGGLGSGALPPEHPLDWQLGCTSSSSGPHCALALVRRGVGVALAVSFRGDMPSRSVFESTTCVTVEVGRWKRRSHEGEKVPRFAAEREMIRHCWGCDRPWRGSSVAAPQRE